MGGCTAMSGWFCSSGLGPGPSLGTMPLTVWKGLAGPRMRAKKKAAMSSTTSVAQPTMGSAARLRKRRTMTTR